MTIPENTDCRQLSQRQVLETLEEIRFDKSRIEPLSNSVPKAGGQADVEAAILLPAQVTHSTEHKATEYVAVKKLRFDEEADDDRVLAVS